ncbi:hypothetical protein [Streptomyces albireticuli]|uniref:hypothetical protein n=1 Tax=Streptomyces albireticuli TaxID=1940 RepID=UPI0036771CFC
MRRKTIVSASASAGAAALVLGTLLAGCGGSDRDGYVATGAAGPGSSRSVDGAVPPRGGVEMVPLDSGSGPSVTPTGKPSNDASAAPSDDPAKDSTAAAPHAPSSAPGPPKTSAGPSGQASPHPGRPPGGGTGGGHSPSAPRPGPGGGRPPEPPAPSSSAPGDGSSPTRPAELTVGTPRREPDEGRRWCERVTVPLHNTGGRPVTAGTLTFGTHVIGPLGVDWVTVRSTAPLPVPIAAGGRSEPAWTVCVDAWRVPLGWHVETRDVTAEWSDTAKRP